MIGLPFHPASYGTAIADLLSIDGQGERLIPLVADAGSRVAAVHEQIVPALFRTAAHPSGALAGLWTYFSYFDEAHGVAQDDSSVEGSYWHGILHRQEPDPGNAGYWFRRVGKHPVFQPLALAAKEIAANHPGCNFRTGTVWDPHAFIEYCESARRKPGSLQEQVALEIQRVEWQLLFDHCATGAGGFEGIKA